MLTFFTTTKAFTGQFDTIQRNAIESWLHSCPTCEIILVGDEEGSRQVADEYGLRLIPRVDCNKYGRPLLNSIFQKVEKISSNSILCYINADIILLHDFLPAVNLIQKWKPNFLIVGQRWKLDLHEPWDFSAADWAERLKARLEKYGSLSSPKGIDYFVFPRGLLRQMPPFAVGRPAWDNWMIYRAHSKRVPVVDATNIITAIHQNHPYKFQKEGGRNVHPYEDVEAQRNRELAGISAHSFGVDDASYFLSTTGIHSSFKRFTPERFIRYLEVLTILLATRLYARVHLLRMMFLKIRRIIKKIEKER